MRTKTVCIREGCGSVFATVTNKQFCSAECKKLHNAPVRACLGCGEEFHPTTTQLYCTPACRQRAATTVTEKRCPRCDTVKPVSAFYGANPERIQGWCAVCSKANLRARRHFYLYGVEERELRRRLEEDQEGKCAICGKELNWDLNRGPLRPATDHIDVDGAPVVRGILCFGCNISLGHFNEDPSLIRRAADYVETLGAVL